MRRSRINVVAVALVGVLVIAACGGRTAVDATASHQTTTNPATAGTPTPTTTETATTAEPASGESTTRPISWTDCDTGESLLVVPLECATVVVPRDHGDPDGASVDIAVARVPAGDPANRIGSLVFNPGGPGASGIEFLGAAALLVSSSISDRFDLVGFDPRGVGDSTALDCDIDWDDNVSVLTDGDDGGWNDLVAEAETFVADCPDATADLAPFVGTNNAARDLDLVRQALGDDRLSYVGFSYGTRLGATYAELFPDRVRALVLDGAVKPTNDLAALGAEQNVGFDRALENFASACDADADCILRELGPTLDVFAGVQSEVRSAGSFETDDPGRVLTPGEFDLAVRSALYSKGLWPFLAQALYIAEVDTDGTLLQILVDNYLGRQQDGAYTSVQEANTFINCADDPNRRSIEDLRIEANEAARSSKYFAELNRADTGCFGIDDALDALVVGPAAGAPPILVIGSTGDPATPYEWAVELADFLDSGVLLSVDAEGHTAYLTIDCVTPVVEAYLVNLDVPADGTTCSDNAEADFFVPAGQSETDQIIAFFSCLSDEGADVEAVTFADVLADPTGEALFGDLDLDDADTLAALFACQHLLPQ